MWPLFLPLFPHYAGPNTKTTLMCLHIAHICICAFALYFVFQNLFMIQYTCFQEAYKDRGWGGFIWALSPLVSNRNWKTCICVLLFATVCFQEAYSNCGGIYLSLVPVGQVIRLTQQERPPAHFCQRWKNKDSIPYYGKRKITIRWDYVFYCFFICHIFLVLDASSMRLIKSGVLICR